jgi:hypothetical protein
MVPAATTVAANKGLILGEMNAVNIEYLSPKRLLFGKDPDSLYSGSCFWLKPAMALRLDP